MGTVDSKSPTKMAPTGLGLVCCLIGLVTSLPPVFDDYFDGDVKIVDVSQDVAIKACLDPSATLLNKISRATKECLGDDDKFDWADFSQLNEGTDTDNNGLSVALENAEACFYGQMGWLLNKVVKKDAIISDFGNLGANVKPAFVADINQCAAWNGKLSSSRRRRSAENPETEEEESMESVESVGLLGWVKSLVRSKRQAPGPKKLPKQILKAKQPLVKKQPLQKQPQAKKQLTLKSRGANIQQKGAKIQPKGKKKKKILKKKKKIPPQKTGGARTAARTIDLEIYNKLWCFDLAVGQALKKCVEDKIRN